MPSCSVSPKNLIQPPIWTFGYFVVVMRVNNISKDLPVLLVETLKAFHSLVNEHDPVFCPAPMQQIGHPPNCIDHGTNTNTQIYKYKNT